LKAVSGRADNALAGLQADPYLTVTRAPKCGSGVALEGGPTANHNLPDTPRPNCGSGLAREGGPTANHSLPDTPRSNCGSGLAREGGPTANHYLPVTPRSNCGSGLAREGGLTADLDVGSDRVHIRYLDNGCYGFRSYSGSLLANAVRVNVSVAILLF
jgi:hypothetical protein